MVKAPTALLDGDEVDIAKALELRDAARSRGAARPLFVCTECCTPVHPNKEGPGSPAGSEHDDRNLACTLSHQLQPSAGRRVRMASWITTAELAARLADGDDYIRTKDGIVKGLALRLDLNPRAPDIMVVGKGPRIEARAAQFVQTGRAVPAYVKRGSNAWDYLGEYRATAYRTDARIIEEFRDTRPSAEVAGILFLECATKITVSVGGGGFADPLTRREVEIAAIDFVTADLIARRFAVHDHQRENRGYDLLAVKADETLRVEVKGTDGPVPRFFLSRNERSCATRDSTWRLAIVTSARRNPALHFMTYAEAEKQFLFDPLAWECTLFGESSQLADKEESSIAPESVALQEPSGSTAP